MFSTLNTWTTLQGKFFSRDITFHFINIYFIRFYNFFEIVLSEKSQTWFQTGFCRECGIKFQFKFTLVSHLTVKSLLNLFREVIRNYHTFSKLSIHFDNLNFNLFILKIIENMVFFLDMILQNFTTTTMKEFRVCQEIKIL